MAIKIDMLRVFVAVAQYGNLTDAANKLGRTPSAVSMMLKQFEEHLGEPLFETDRKNKLTALGVFVLEQSERELDHFNGTIRAIEGFADASLGRVRVATVPSIAGTLIPRMIARNAQRYENVHLELRDMDSKSVVKELMQARVDIGIATLLQKHSGLHRELLLTDRFGIVCSPQNPLAQRGGPVDLENVEGQRFLANSLSAAITDPQAAKLHGAARITVYNMTSIIGALQANIGVTLLPETAVRNLPRSEVVFLPLRDRDISREVYLLYRPDAALTPAAQAFAQDIRDTAANLPDDLQS